MEAQKSPKPEAPVEAHAERPRFYPVRLPAEASAPPTLRLVVNALVADPLQLPLFPEKERPVSCLAHFAGHVLPAAVAAEVGARRRWRGLTQAQVAEQIGISRPQLVNALKGRFPVVAVQWAAARLSASSWAAM